MSSARCSEVEEIDRTRNGPQYEGSCDCHIIPLRYTHLPRHRSVSTMYPRPVKTSDYVSQSNFFRLITSLEHPRSMNHAQFLIRIRPCQLGIATLLGTEMESHGHVRVFFGIPSSSAIEAHIAGHSNVPLRVKHSYPLSKTTWGRLSGKVGRGRSNPIWIFVTLVIILREFLATCHWASTAQHPHWLEYVCSGVDEPPWWYVWWIRTCRHHAVRTQSVTQIMALPNVKVEQNSNRPIIDATIPKANTMVFGSSRPVAVSPRTIALDKPPKEELGQYTYAACVSPCHVHLCLCGSSSSLPIIYPVLMQSRRLTCCENYGATRGEMGKEILKYTESKKKPQLLHSRRSPLKTASMRL